MTDIADNSLSGEVKITGSLMRGDCQNTNGDWFRVDYDDFTLLLAKLSANTTVLDVTEVTLKNPYWDQIQEKCPGITIKLTDGEITEISSMQNPKSTTYSDVYDLLGRRISHPSQGLYIVGGKKVLVK